MNAQIILVRHAKVCIDNWIIYASDMGKFIEFYNSADIEEELNTNIPKAEVYVASQLKRSLVSLELLGVEVTVSDAVFNEAQLPYVDKRGIKLPAMLWAPIFRVMWLFGYSNHSESYTKAKERAEKGADMLVNLAKENRSVLLMGHGVMNRLIIKALKKRGWLVVQKQGSGNGEYSIMKDLNDT